MYELFVGPPELDAEWDDRGIEGVARFLNRFYNLVMDSKDKDIKETKEMVKLRHKLVYDIETRFNQFSLNTVLSYKQQVLEELQNEHGQLLYQVRQQELVLQAAEERYRGLNLEFRQAETEGLTIAEALRYESGLRFLEDEIQREAKRLREYEAAAEEKRRQVVAARQDTASLEKLKDKKWEDYQKQVQKGEELLIEELVTAARARTAV